MLGKRNFLAIATVILIACGEQGINSDYQNEPSSEVSKTPSPIYLAVSPSDSESEISQPLSGGETSSPQFCQDFDENETRLHYRKWKKQICDKRDGTKYVWVTIGTQDWLAENLRIATDKNGNSIGRCYKDDIENCKIYGRLYVLAEAICPEGWHIPSHSELAILLKYADPNYREGSEFTGLGNNESGLYLKTISGWTPEAQENPNGNDRHGFSALPGGFCGGGCPDNNMTTPPYPGTSTGTFTALGAMSYWWTTNVGSPAPLAITWAMTTDVTVNDGMQSYPHSRFYARCVRD